MVIKTRLSRRTWLSLVVAVLAGMAAAVGCTAAEEEAEQAPTPTPWHSPSPPATGATTAQPTRAPAPTSVGTTPPAPSPTEPTGPTVSLQNATPISVVTSSGVTPEPTPASPSPAPTIPTEPTAGPSPLLGPIEGVELDELAVDETGTYYIPKRGDGCTWTQRLALTPLEGGDSPIIVLYSDCEAKFYLAYYVTQHYIGNVTKAPVYQPLPLTPVDIGLGADGKYYVPDRGDGCAYREIARPTIGGQQWVMLRSELCHHFLWRFSLGTGELFPMDPLWWPDRSAPSPSDIQVGPDGRYFIVRTDGCTWVESSRADTRVSFTTECTLSLTFAFVYDTATGEFHDVGLP
jgi:hypothetical protein